MTTEPYDDNSPAGTLRALAATGRTGAVRFSGTAGCTVYLHRGQLYFARDDHTDEALAAALVRPGRLTADDWSSAIEAAADHPRVGELLVTGGSIESDLLASVVLSVIYDPLIRLFLDGDGAHDFETDTVHWIGPFRTFNAEAIIAEVERRTDEAREMSGVIPSVDCVVNAARSLPGTAAQVTLLREDWELVTALSATDTISGLAGELGRGAYSTARVVFRLAQAGLLEVGEERPPLDDAAAWISSDGTTEVAEEPAGVPTPDDPPAPAAWDATPAPTEAPDDLEFASFFSRDSDAGRRQQPADEDPWTPPSWGDDGEGEFVPSLPSREPAQAVNAAGTLPHRAGGWPAAEDLGEAESWEGSEEAPFGGLALRSAVAPTQPIRELTDESLEGDLPPNAAWLESLYEQFMDEPEEGGRRRKKEAIDVAFAAPTEPVDEENKVGTLRRLFDAIKRL